MALPFNPRPIDELRKKVPFALEKVWIANDQMDDRPGLHPEYIFDFDTGIRLIISRDKLPGFSRSVIHVSASSMGLGTSNIAMIYAALDSIGLHGTLNVLGVSPKGVGHWILMFNT